MNARIRMMADARSLFWPWCIVAAVGLLSVPYLSLLPFGLEMDVVAGIVFCIGFPLLATLSFGNEFQFGTFSSLLSQPIERSTIWREKLAVIVVAVPSAAIAYAFGAHRMGWAIQDITVLALWLMVTVGSSAYWTLLARSTIGGLVLNGLQSMALVLIFVPQLNRFRANRPELLLAIGSFALAYTAVLLYLGRRKLLRFQVTGAGPGSNVLATNWGIPLSKLLRPTASGGTLNLVRKEIHLLWPLLPLTAIALGSLLAVLPLRFVSGDRDWIVSVGISIVFIHGSLVAILAGALSLGEERSLGLHAWNMTLPVSVLRQWAIKLGTVVFASAACCGAVMLVGHLFWGPDLLEQFGAIFHRSSGMLTLVIFPLLTFVAFWCASGVNGTVRAAFWCFPAAVAVLVAYGFGISASMSNGAVEVVSALTETVHPFPFSSQFEVIAQNLIWSSQRSFLAPALWFGLGMLPAAAIQSYRLFRSEIREGMMPLIRAVLLLAAVGFLSGFLQIVPAAASGTMHRNTVRTLMEVSRGVAAMQIAPAAVSDAGYAVSLETISKSAPLSDRTRSWFASETVVIRPKGAKPSYIGYAPLEESRYMISAELHGGWKCVFADKVDDVRYGVGRMGVPRGANYMFECTSKNGKLGWLKTGP
jgi:hypothetical protein